MDSQFELTTLDDGDDMDDTHEETKEYDNDDDMQKIISDIEKGEGGSEEKSQQQNDLIEKEFRAAQKLTRQPQFATLFILLKSTPLDLMEGEELFKILDVDNSEKLTIKEVVDGCAVIGCNEKARSYLEEMKNTPLGLLRRKGKVQHIFKSINVVGDDSVVTMNEWKLFLVELVVRDADWLIEQGWAENLCYWARTNSRVLEMPYFLFCSWEYLADFWYYECNNHPLLSIFFRDNNNTLKSLERLIVEFAAVTWTFLVTVIIASRPHANGIDYNDPWQQYSLVFVCITIPTIIQRMVLVKCFQCPCLIRRDNIHEAMGCARKYVYPMLESLGGFVGALAVSAGLLYMAIAVYLLFQLEDAEHIAANFQMGWVLGFFYAFVQDWSLQFNPLVVARCFVELPSSYTLGLSYMLGYFGLAKWQVQRRLVRDVRQSYGEALPVSKSNTQDEIIVDFGDIY